MSLFKKNTINFDYENNCHEIKIDIIKNQNETQ